MAKRAPPVSTRRRAAIRSPTPEIASRPGARGPIRVAISALSACSARVISPIRAQQLAADPHLHAGDVAGEPLGETAPDRLAVQGPGEGLELRVDFVQVPAQPRDDRGALGDEILAVVEQELQLA